MNLNILEERVFKELNINIPGRNCLTILNEILKKESNKSNLYSLILSGNGKRVSYQLAIFEGYIQKGYTEGSDLRKVILECCAEVLGIKNI